MPLPWDAPGGPTRIKDVAERAITVKQLRDLRTFLQRLSKTCLLRNTTEFSRGNGTFGRPITWRRLNLYQVTDEVIKRVVPHVDPEGEKDPGGTKRRWYSWMELVARKPQPAKIMVSHWWGGHFRDFMLAIDKLVADRSLSINTAIWVCTFANCQFGEDFGTMLQECPFIRALQTVELTVLVVDFQGGSLTRTWCGLEVHYTTEQEMELVLYTSAGKVGSRYVSGGPLVEAVTAWDIRRSEASDPPYRRQILNYVAGVSELDGLQGDGAGGMQVDDLGRPQLQGGLEEALDPEAPRRITGDQEYLYESALFRKHGKRFEDLNMMVRLTVMSNIGVGRKARGCVGAVPSHAGRGLTLGQLRVISKKLQATCPWLPSTCPWWRHGDKHWDALESMPYEVLHGQLVVSWVKHLTASAKCSLMETVSDGPQVPQFFVEQAWAQPWSEKMRAIELFAEAQQLPDSAVFFVDIFCMNQHTPFLQEVEIPQLQQGVAMHECEGLLCILSDDPAQMRRMWIWHFVEKAVRSGSSIFIASKDGVLACNQPFASGGWVCGHFDLEMARKIGELDVREMTTTKEADRELILQYIRRNADGAPGSMHDGIAQFHVRLRCWCAGPILRGAAKTDDRELIRSVCKWPGLRLNSDALKAELGRTPLHIAAAYGHSKAMLALLEAGMDPNIEDDIKERPLHYAALAGRADEVRGLLAARADPWAENAFAETPLQVAEQNPAAFLGVDLQEVVRLLAEAGRPTAAGSAMFAARDLAKDSPPSP